ncbi:MAG: dTDP-4-dehydrorhamnose 3,5-epimerase [Bacteroidota bacterium]
MFLKNKKMNITPTKLNGAYILNLVHFEDERGSFIKTFHTEIFKENKLDIDFKESYFSTSIKNVIRGMHFQLPPHDHSKLVYPVEGRVLDVLLDLRMASPTYGQYCTVELSCENKNGIYIPKGLAHGFRVLSDSATLVYMTTTVYNKGSDTGIRWDSFGFDWQVDNPLVSERDKGFVEFKDFKSPF